MCTPFSRRGFVVSAGLLALTACTPRTDPSSLAPDSPPRTSGARQPSPTTPSPSANPTDDPTPTIPDRAAIVDRFAHRTPTQWGSDGVTGLVRRTDSNAVVLTFDGCGGPGGSQVDGALLDLLEREEIPAVLFLNHRWITANRATVDRILAQPDLFEIGNHGTRHLPLSVTGRSAYAIAGTQSPGEVYDEVMGNHVLLTELTGHPPRWFRTGTAWYDDVAIEIVRELGEVPIGFDINGDAGATLPASQVARQTERAIEGSIVIAHLNQPQGGTAEGMLRALPRLRERGVRFATLTGAGLS